MSEGPIKRERDAWKPKEVSTPDAHRVCMVSEPGSKRSYCGRSKASRVGLVTDWADVECADCDACRRADEAVQ